MREFKKKVDAVLHYTVRERQGLGTSAGLFPDDAGNIGSVSI